MECCRVRPDSAVALAREKFQLGAREDFRYADMRVKYGRQWWWVSFLVVYLLQQVEPRCQAAICTTDCTLHHFEEYNVQVMLVGLTLPLHSIHSSSKPWHPVWDTAAAAGCLLGGLLATPVLTFCLHVKVA